MSNTTYIVRRTAYAILGVFVAITLNFFLFRVLPGSAASDLAHAPGASPNLVRSLEIQFGLDKPKWEQYFIYLEQLAHGNLGVSFHYNQPVSGLLVTALGNTLLMIGFGTAIAIAVGLASGVVAAARRGRASDHVTSSLAMAFWAMPAQWLALILLVAFSAYLPTNGMSDPFLLNPSPVEKVMDVFRHMLLPSLAVALTAYGGLTLIARSAVLDSLGADYMLTARAKGLPNSKIIINHALRNALLPITTFIALAVGNIVGGNILIESVFSWPGIGRATYEAVTARDYPMLQGAFLVVTLSVVFCNYVADLLYLKLDPRIAR